MSALSHLMPSCTYLSNPGKQRKCRLNGVQRSTRLPVKAQLRGHFANHMRFSAPQLPPKVNLRFQMTPVENQSSIGSCVANSFAGAYEYLLRKTSGCDIDVSRLFIYYNARLKDGEAEDDLSDSGCTVTSAIEALEESGTCLESIWPYHVKRVNTCPSDEAYEAAASNRISSALQINIDLHEMKSCLAQGFPFVFGLALYKSFDRAAKKGVVPMPNAKESSRETDGNHVMLAVGYSDQSRAFIVRNSWGDDWGDEGYCYIPYAYMTDEKYCFDPWTVRQLETDDMGHEHWDEDDSVDYADDDGEDDDDEGEVNEDDDEEEEEED